MSAYWPTAFGDNDSSSSQVRKRKRVNGCDDATSSGSKSGDTSWVSRNSPKSFEELAVHKKKIAEVEAWISQTKFAKGAPILLMTGPSGCGKTATVLVTATAHSIEVQEWTNPLSVSFSTTKEAGLRYEGLSSQFEEFLFRGGRYPSLAISEGHKPVEENNNSSKLLLLEDLPHHIIREPTTFRDTLRQYSRFQKHPLIIILSDRSIPDSTKRNLLPPDVLAKLRIQKISFNPIATTAMTKALSRIIAKENLKLSKENLAQVVSTSSGDIRTAINSMQFLVQKGVPMHKSMPELKKVKSSLKRRKSVDLIKSDELSAVGGKDISLLLFRALGKILYCKREEPDPLIPPLPQHLEKYYRDPLVFEPEEILEHCCLSGPAYSLFLHHNCVPFFSKMNDLSPALDDFCLGDIIGTRRSGVDFSVDSTAALDAYEGSLTARSVAFWNSDRATSKLCESATGKWRPLHKPSWYQVGRKCNENQSLSHSLFWNYNLPNQELLLNLLPYLQKIFGDRNRNFSSKNPASQLNLDFAQREFLSSAVSLPKWKSYSSGNLERIDGVETGEPMLEDSTVDDFSSCPNADGNIESAEKDPEEDFIIDDFDDSN